MKLGGIEYLDFSAIDKHKEDRIANEEQRIDLLVRVVKSIHLNSLSGFIYVN